MATLNDADDVWARYLSLPREYKDTRVAEIIVRLEQEARSYRDALASFELAANKSVSGMSVPMGEWLDLIGKAQRVLRQAGDHCVCDRRHPDGARFCNDCGKRVYWMKSE